jgi:mycothiol system anti-sigma-R factor
MVLSCREVWEEISNYLDGEVDAATRAGIEAHLAQCRHCSALYDSTHNVLVLIADDRTFHLPAGFSERLSERLRRAIATEE